MGDWKIGESRTLLHTFIWDVIEIEKEMPNGKKGNFVSLKAPNWCSAVIRNTDTGKFVMVREFRHGVNAWIYGFSCGTVEEGESPEDGVVREVAEETGYRNPKIVRRLYTANPNPAFMSNTTNCYYIEVSGEREAQSLDESEFVNVIEVDDPSAYLNESSSLTAQLAWERYCRLVASKETCG